MARPGRRGPLSGPPGTPGPAWSLPRSDQVVLQLDLDPAELGRAFPLEAGMLGDARAGVLALSAALAESPEPEPDRAAWRARLAALAGSWRDKRDAERASDRVPIAPQRVLGELERVLRPDDLLVCDASLASG